MYTKQEIILKSYREGKSQRSINQELGISRCTVSRYISQYESLLESGIYPDKALQEYLSTIPGYFREVTPKVKLTAKVTSAIDALLLVNEERKRQGLRKQLLKKRDILSNLHSQGISIEYTSVCNYIREKEGKTHSKEAYIRQAYAPGNECEFDWGEIKLYINGILTRLHVFTAAYSNYRYALIYHRQDTFSFMESHIASLGIYKELIKVWYMIICVGQLESSLVLMKKSLQQHYYSFGATTILAIVSVMPTGVMKKDMLNVVLNISDVKALV